MSTHPVEMARRAAGLSQRELATRAGLSQPTLSRIIAGDRAAKMTELIALAEATGWSVGALAGQSAIGDRAQCAARVTDGAEGQELRAGLLHFLELDAYLEDQAVL